MKVVSFDPKPLDYNFDTDEIVESERWNNVEQLTANDNVRYSIISIMNYILDNTVNDYMIKFCENVHSIKEPFHKPSECKILAKNEFLGFLNRNLSRDGKPALVTDLIAGNI